MRALILYLLLFVLPFNLLFAQETDTIYFDKGWKKISSKTNPEVVYMTILHYPDKAKNLEIEKTFFITGEKHSEKQFQIDISKEYEIRTGIGLSTSWYKNGQMKNQRNYNTGKLEGTDKHWFEDGRIAHESYYQDGKKQGEAYDYYADGKVRRQEKFANDSLLVGKCFTKTGSDTIYFPMEEVPIFTGGEPGIVKFLVQNIRYPRKDLRKGIRGLVVVQFVVNKTGAVSDWDVVKKVSPAIDAESIRVVQLMSGQFKPARQEGKPVSYRYTLPIRFDYN